MSPPRITRPCDATPPINDPETDATPAIAPTPSAIQAMKTTKPSRPARMSRSASRRRSGMGGACGARHAGQRSVHRPSDRRGGRNRRRDAPRPQADHPVACPSEGSVVRDEDEGRPALAIDPKQEVGDRPPGRLVEVAGRFVRDDDRRIGARARGQLRRAAVRLPIIEPDSDAGGLRGRPRQAPGRPERRRRSRRRVRAAAPRSRAPSWSGSGGTIGRRCRCGDLAPEPDDPRRAPRDRRRRRRHARNPASRVPPSP